MTHKASRWHPETSEKRFWCKVWVTNSCWEWQASTYPYGAFRVDGKMTTAHRFAYELLRGAIPEGYHLDHLCRNPGCVNPWHLEPVTLEENMQRELSIQKELGTYKNAMSRKVCCPRGHLFDVENTYLNKQGKRECRACHRERRRQERGSIKQRKHAPVVQRGVV